LSQRQEIKFTISILVATILNVRRPLKLERIGCAELPITKTRTVLASVTVFFGCRHLRCFRLPVTVYCTVFNILSQKQGLDGDFYEMTGSPDYLYTLMAHNLGIYAAIGAFQLDSIIISRNCDRLSYFMSWIIMMK